MEEMDRKKEVKERQTAFIRCDGWVISADGMQRLTKAGHKGHDRFMGKQAPRPRCGGDCEVREGDGCKGGVRLKGNRQ